MAPPSTPETGKKEEENSQQQAFGLQVLEELKKLNATTTQGAQTQTEISQKLGDPSASSSERKTKQQRTFNLNRDKTYTSSPMPSTKTSKMPSVSGNQSSIAAGALKAVQQNQKSSNNAIQNKADVFSPIEKSGIQNKRFTLDVESAGIQASVMGIASLWRGGAFGKGVKFFYTSLFRVFKFAYRRFEAILLKTLGWFKDGLVLGFKAILAPFKLGMMIIEKFAEFGGNSREEIQKIDQSLSDTRDKFSSLSTGIVGSTNKFAEELYNMRVGKGSFYDVNSIFARTFGMDVEGITNAVNKTAETLDNMKNFSEVFTGIFGNMEKMAILERLVGALGLEAEDVAYHSQEAVENNKHVLVYLGEILKERQRISKINGVDEKRLGQFYNTLRKDITNFDSISDRSLLKISARFQKIGLDAENISEVINKFSTFEDAAKSAAMLSQTFGMYIDPLKLIETDDPLEIINMFEKGLKGIGRTFDSMNRHERKILADNTGLSIRNIKTLMMYRKQGYSMEAAQAKIKADDPTEKQITALKNLTSALNSFKESINIRVFTSGMDAVAKSFSRLMSGLEGKDNIFNRLSKQLETFGIKVSQQGDAAKRLFKIMGREIDPVIKAYNGDAKQLEILFDKVTGLMDNFSANQEKIEADYKEHLKNKEKMSEAEITESLKNKDKMLEWYYEKNGKKIKEVLEFMSSGRAGFNAFSATYGLGMRSIGISINAITSSIGPLSDFLFKDGGVTGVLEEINKSLENPDRKMSEAVKNKIDNFAKLTGLSSDQILHFLKISAKFTTQLTSYLVSIMWNAFKLLWDKIKREIYNEGSFLNLTIMPLLKPMLDKIESIIKFAYSKIVQVLGETLTPEGLGILSMQQMNYEENKILQIGEQARLFSYEDKEKPVGERYSVKDRAGLEQDLAVRLNNAAKYHEKMKLQRAALQTLERSRDNDARLKENYEEIVRLKRYGKTYNVLLDLLRLDTAKSQEKEQLKQTNILIQQTLDEMKRGKITGNFKSRHHDAIIEYFNLLSSPGDKKIKFNEDPANKAISMYNNSLEAAKDSKKRMDKKIKRFKREQTHSFPLLYFPRSKGLGFNKITDMSDQNLKEIKEDLTRARTFDLVSEMYKSSLEESQKTKRLNAIKDYHLQSGEILVSSTDAIQSYYAAVHESMALRGALEALLGDIDKDNPVKNIEGFAKASRQELGIKTKLEYERLSTENRQALDQFLGLSQLIRSLSPQLEKSFIYAQNYKDTSLSYIAQQKTLIDNKKMTFVGDIGDTTDTALEGLKEFLQSLSDYAAKNESSERQMAKLIEFGSERIKIKGSNRTFDFYNDKLFNPKTGKLEPLFKLEDDEYTPTGFFFEQDTEQLLAAYSAMLRDQALGVIQDVQENPSKALVSPSKLPLMVPQALPVTPLKPINQTYKNQFSPSQQQGSQTTQQMPSGNLVLQVAVDSKTIAETVAVPLVDLFTGAKSPARIPGLQRRSGSTPAASPNSPGR